jgi:hypothetical protein
VTIPSSGVIQKFYYIYDNLYRYTLHKGILTSDNTRGCEW